MVFRQPAKSVCTPRAPFGLKDIAPLPLILIAVYLCISVWVLSCFGWLCSGVYFTSLLTEEHQTGKGRPSGPRRHRTRCDRDISQCDGRPPRIRQIRFVLLQKRTIRVRAHRMGPQVMISIQYRFRCRRPLTANRRMKVHGPFLKATSLAPSSPTEDFAHDTFQSTSSTSMASGTPRYGI